MSIFLIFMLGYIILNLILGVGEILAVVSAIDYIFESRE